MLSPFLPFPQSIDALKIGNPSVAALYEDALVYETGSAITSTGALTAYSGAKTGRSPLDKRIVKEESSEKDVWWGPVNKAMTPEVCRLHAQPNSLEQATLSLLYLRVLGGRVRGRCHSHVFALGIFSAMDVFCFPIPTPHQQGSNVLPHYCRLWPGLGCQDFGDGSTLHQSA